MKLFWKLLSISEIPIKALYLQSSKNAKKKKAKIKSDIINVKVQKVYFNIFLFPSKWSLTHI